MPPVAGVHVKRRLRFLRHFMLPLFSFFVCDKSRAGQAAAVRRHVSKRKRARRSNGMAAHVSPMQLHRHVCKCGCGRVIEHAAAAGALQPRDKRLQPPPVFLP